jgi:hypothetical protein
MLFAHLKRILRLDRLRLRGPRLILYTEVKRDKIELPQRQKRGDYREQSYEFRRVPEKY